MSTLLINAGSDSTQIFEEILDSIAYTSESFTIVLEENSVIVTINDETNSIVYMNYIASKITNFILNFIEPKIIREEVDLGCLDLLDFPIKNDIAEKVEWDILHRSEKLRRDYFSYIKDEIFNGLKNHGLFNLSGYLHFRFNMRRLEIRDYVNIALENYFSEESDEQFISLIKRVVSIQKPKLESMHIILIDLDDYELITSNMERVDMKDAERIIDEFMYNQSDAVERLHLILSVLMTLIPSKIIIHKNEKHDPYVTQIIKRIYEDRVEICEGCEFCNKFRLARKEENEE